MRLEGLAVAASTIDRLEADLIAAALRSEGIPVTYNQDSRRSMMGGGLLGPGTHGADPLIEILVPDDRLDEAREVVRVTTLGEDTLPPEFRDEVWDEHVGVRHRRRRRVLRLMVLTPIYLALAVIVLALVIVAVSKLGS
jgi:hypothetical protein